MPALADLKIRRAECEVRLIDATRKSSSGMVLGYLTQGRFSPDEAKNLIDVAAKGALAQMLRDVGARGTSDLHGLIKLLTELVSAGQCSPFTVCNLLTELFDQSPLEQCQKLFSIVEDRATLWKSEQYFETCKNVLLRTCNDLLRRSSKSLDTVFCGRVQLFLARLFPLDEKSALNLMGQFNIENVTLFRTEPWDVGAAKEEPPTAAADDTESMQVDDNEMAPTDAIKIEPDSDSAPKSLLVDFELYSKFWSLQDVFRNPNMLLTSRAKFAAFYDTAQYITGILRTYPLDEHDAAAAQQLVAMLDDETAQQASQQATTSSGQGVFFSKYLTNEKLLDLQLSDSNFRRCILLQFLITLQYLVTPAKVKGQMALAPDQERVVTQLSEACLELLKKTPPRGDHFASAVERILSGEQYWCQWKNEACPSFVKQPGALSVKRLRRRRPLGDELAASAMSRRPIRLGSNELNRLFASTTPGGSYVDNLPLCRSPSAQPGLADFFSEAISQLAPDSEVPEDQKLLRKSEWQWRALRLLTSVGPTFFSSVGDRPSGPPKKLAMPVPDFLNIHLRLLAPSLGIKLTQTGAAQNGPHTPSKSKSAPGVVSAAASPMQASHDGPASVSAEQDASFDEAPSSGGDGGGDAGEAAQSAAASSLPLVKDHKTAIALLISAHWQTLAKHLKFEDDIITFFEATDVDDKSKQAEKMLELWEERESNYGRKIVPVSQFEAELRRHGGLDSIADRLRHVSTLSKSGT